MKALAKEVIGTAEMGRMMSDKDVSKFSPMEIREAIQTLVTEGKDALANALGDAGLSLYPDSEDILAITGLLALMRQDWAYAVDLMEQLHQLQGDKRVIHFLNPFQYHQDLQRHLIIESQHLFWKLNHLP